MTYNAEGIILRYRDVGEFDRIYTVLSAEHGKIDAWAQGVRKPKSKLVAHLQPLYFCDFMFARGRRFDRIAQVRIINRFPELWADLQKLSHAMYATSLVDMVLRPGTKEKSVFELLNKTLAVISSEDHIVPPPQSSPTRGEEEKTNSPPLVGGVRGGGQGEAIITIFSLHLLRETGFSPELFHCVICKGDAQGLSQHFDAVRGGVVCAQCCHPERVSQRDPFGEGSLAHASDRPAAAGRDSSSRYRGTQNDENIGFSVSALTLETLDTILSSPLVQLEMPDAISRELTVIAEAMMAAHFGEEPKAKTFMDSLVRGLPQMVGV